MIRRERPAAHGPVTARALSRACDLGAAACAILGAALTGIVCAAAQESTEEVPLPTGEDFRRLVRDLDAADWVPPWLQGRAPVFDPLWAERRIQAMAAERYSMVRAGRLEYRTSRKRVIEGRRLFFLFDWGSAEYWRSNTRYQLYSLGVSRVEDLEARYGFRREPGGRVLGLVGMPSRDGRVDYGWSCALCHAAPGPDGHPVAGAPNHDYNPGLIRHQALVAHQPRPDFVTADFVDRDVPVARLADLGPGRMDRNGDRVLNPVKIPPLWGLREIRSGLFANGSGTNIWYVLGTHNGGVHPASEFLEALVAYVLSIEAPPNPRVAGPREARGREIFQREACGECHSGPYYTTGRVIPLEEIGTDGRRVEVEFPKGYRVPTLRRLDLQKLFLHDGSLRSLERLFDRSRLESVPGHEYGMDLTEKECSDLVAFLLSL